MIWKYPIPVSTPKPPVCGGEAAQILSAAMHKLTPPMRTVVELRELGELSTRETALRMGLSVAAVKARVFLGRRKLRKTLESLEITTKAIFSN